MAIDSIAFYSYCLVIGVSEGFVLPSRNSFTLSHPLLFDIVCTLLAIRWLRIPPWLVSAILEMSVFLDKPV